MSDPRILRSLSSHVAIAGHVYWVQWNSEKQVAEVLRDGGVIASFPFELAAHQHISDIASLDQTKDIDSWKNIS